MDFGSIGERVLLVLVIIGAIFLISLLRRRDPKKERAEIVRQLLTDTRINLILVDTFDRQPAGRRFEATTWQLHKKKLVFLEKPVQADMENAFGKALDYNRRLRAAKKSKSTEKIVPDFDGIKAPLLRIKAGLEDWLLTNVGSVDAPTQFTGITDGLFGSR